MNKISEIFTEPNKVCVGDYFKIKIKCINYMTYDEVKAKTYDQIKTYTYSELKGE